MNERIKELAEQAFDKQNDGTLSDIKIPKMFIEMFAELIVRECIDYCGENLSKTVGGALKIHFGVKQ